MSSYISDSEFTEAMTGVQTNTLAAGVLTKYVQRASALIEGYTHRNFVPSSSVVEALFSNSAGRAVIDVTNGYVLLYPTQKYPISSITSLTWQLMPRGTAQALSAADYWIEPDQYGDGFRVHVGLTFVAYRDPADVVKFTLTYAGGYGTPSVPAYPDWLKEAAIEWTAHLLKKRGAQALVIQGSGVAVDQSTLGGHLSAAHDALDPHVRRF